MTKVQLTDANGVQVELESPISMVVKKCPPSKPDEFVALYWSQAEKYLEHNLDYGLRTLQRDDLDPEQVARSFVGEHHDAPYVFHWLGGHFENQQALDYSDQLLTLILPYIVGRSKGMPGYHCYNRGAIARRKLDVAKNIADLSNYSSTKHQTPNNPYWEIYGGEGAPNTRDFSLAVIAHLYWQNFMRDNGFFEYDDKRDDYTDNVKNHILLKNAEWFIRTGNDASDDELATKWRNLWYPYLITHLTRALIELDTRTRLIRSADKIPQLCDVMWDRAYRGSEGRWGLAYQLDREDPAPDLSLWTMPCYAYAWHVTSDRRHKERALKLMESGLRWAYLAGHRQFCQSYMWSKMGLVWLGSKSDG